MDRWLCSIAAESSFNGVRIGKITLVPVYAVDDWRQLAQGQAYRESRIIAELGTPQHATLRYLT
ncbi:MULTISPECIES: hypothetical protein [Burkholderia cepacia complex]|jgi:hypothetical protein|uniref:Uncharacterized protein n=1 Tax=Burkholderia stagnalis TaxID=1503054 RepID=A0ABX9YCS4_9BURK|nr:MULTISPECIES: hypothetical protein [Burkholderia cepacia complex]AMU17357.1 hypothetical protein A3203_31690 [Burkholderia cenocepacia]MCW3587858.1 hypothetical protein [Burkholderia cenocepacia]MCW3632741.1 hypothetical protein [Burkholderia cenocepacia]MCW5182197.1 hypothetical protein [Burkholderia cenocepacia]NGO92732.1 hypothetical protein [Burkholderia cenocepacia]